MASGRAGAGERRLKNAVMVLEWVPQAGQLSPLPTGASEMSAAQQVRLAARGRPRVAWPALPPTPALEPGRGRGQARLASALRLLDFDSSGSYERGTP